MSTVTVLNSAPDFAAVVLSLKLAGLTTFILLLLGMPLAWWLATTRSRLKPIAEALTALPLVLPPTVLGFYLLVIFSPDMPLGHLFVELSGRSLTFSFSGLVIASVIYSLPFMVQPLASAFEAIGAKPMETAASLGAAPLDAFWHVVLPLAKRGIITALVLTFTHTLGEFGVVLMVGGNIPNETRVLSIAIYEHVETLQYAQAHVLAAGLLLFSFFGLLVVYTVNRRFPFHVR